MNHPFIECRARIIFRSKRFRHSQTPLPSRRLRKSYLDYRKWIANPQSNPADTKSTVDLGCEKLIWVDNTPQFPLFPAAHPSFPPIRTRPPGASNRNHAKSNQKIIRTASLIWVEGAASSKTPTARGASRSARDDNPAQPLIENADGVHSFSLGLRVRELPQVTAFPIPPLNSEAPRSGQPICGVFRWPPAIVSTGNQQHPCIIPTGSHIKNQTWPSLSKASQT